MEWNASFDACAPTWMGSDDDPTSNETEALSHADETKSHLRRAGLEADTPVPNAKTDFAMTAPKFNPRVLTATVLNDILEGLLRNAV